MHPVLNEYLTNKVFKHDCWNLAKSDADDLFQEVALILLEKPVHSLDSVWSSGGCRWYIQKLMWNTYLGKRQLFDKKYRDKWQRVDFDTFCLFAVDNNELESKIEREKYHDAFLVAVERLNEIDKQTIHLTMFYKSTREFATFSGIPYKTLSTNIKRIRETLKNEILKITKI